MAKKQDVSKTAGISDDAVHAKTGKSWSQWIKVLDKVGGRNIGHQAIAVHLRERCGLSGWWSQMVTVGYEQAVGLREKHQKKSGYEISGSKTLAVPIQRAFSAWKDPARRRRWLSDGPLKIRSFTEDKVLRFTWGDGQTNLITQFYAKGSKACQVTVQHGKLASAKEAAVKKAYWKDQLRRLKQYVETQDDPRRGSA